MKVKISGTLTRSDYHVMSSTIQKSITKVKKPKIKVLMDATDFNGRELRAAWDDFKFGLHFRNVFTEMAFVGTKTWERYGVNVGNIFMNGQIKYFESLNEALDWLKQENIVPSTPVAKDLQNRKDEIQNELSSLFESNLSVVDVNVPEADNNEASRILVKILEEKLKKIKIDAQNGKYE